jgi:hypothetical protein
MTRTLLANVKKNVLRPLLFCQTSLLAATTTKTTDNVHAYKNTHRPFSIRSATAAVFLSAVFLFVSHHLWPWDRPVEDAGRFFNFMPPWIPGFFNTARRRNSNPITASNCWNKGFTPPIAQQSIPQVKVSPSGALCRSAEQPASVWR